MKTHITIVTFADWLLGLQFDPHATEICKNSMWLSKSLAHVTSSCIWTRASKKCQQLTLDYWTKTALAREFQLQQSVRRCPVRQCPVLPPLSGPKRAVFGRKLAVERPWSGGHLNGPRTQNADLPSPFKQNLSFLCCCSPSSKLI